MATNRGNFDNPLILAVETSGRMGSVALAAGDKLCLKPVSLAQCATVRRFSPQSPIY